MACADVLERIEHAFIRKNVTGSYEIFNDRVHQNWDPGLVDQSGGEPSCLSHATACNAAHFLRPRRYFLFQEFEGRLID